MVLLAGACGDDGGHNQDDAPPGTVQVLQRPSRSSTIALADDGAHVAMVNPEDGTLSVFQTSDNSRTAKVATGSTPAGVVIAPDSKTAYVANRGDGTVVRVANIDGGTPAVDATAQVGSEPIGLALSPTGKVLFVAEFAESRVSVIDTATMTVTSSFAVDRPRALVVTNNGDTDALELRLANGAAVRAEGRAGFNVPSLYGLAVGAPYLHHGQSPSLNELFTNDQWGFHTNAGNANFSVTLAGAGKLEDLIGFLLSIDATTPEIAVPTDPGTGLPFDVCPAS